jgi:hypothetical protein
MAVLAGYSTIIYVTGTSTALSAAAMTGSGAGPYTLSDATKTILDPTVTPTFRDNGTPISAGDILSVDYLRGKVMFTGSKTGPITMHTGSYLPKYAVAGCREFSLDLIREVLDTTVFHASNSHRTKVLGLLSASGELGHIEQLDTDIDSSGDTMSWNTILSNGTAKVIDIYAAQNQSHRLWVLFDTEGLKAALDGLVEGSISFQSSAQTAADGTVVSYSAA